ncbi:MAG: BlaI/MecI/CopY family transcriptional regulator [Phycisphaerales bacterium]|nr:BlaI/MecI/CopY family transcriptional regulator [Phycisphaerales bacterium]
MARRPAERKPTDAELAILDVIWERGSATVREVFEIIGERQEVGYTTVLKLMQIMTDKGLLERDVSVRPQVFRAARARGQTQRLLLGDLLDRAFAGSPGRLVLQALSMRSSTPEELREIRALLDELEGDAP